MASFNALYLKPGPQQGGQYLFGGYLPQPAHAGVSFTGTHSRMMVLEPLPGAGIALASSR